MMVETASPIGELAAAPSLALFGIPKPFAGHIGVIQRNAIRSWAALATPARVILAGDAPGAGELARDLDVLHVPGLRANEQGTPLLSDAFHQARSATGADLLGYVNADILLLDDFAAAVAAVAAQLTGPFLMIGRRINADIREELDFSSPEWRKRVQAMKRASGRLAPRVCKDFFVFPRDLYRDLPDFAVGRANWDNWMVYEAHRRGVPVVDVTAVTTVIHQNHDYGHLQRGMRQAYLGPEARSNRDLAGGTRLVKGSAANWVLTRRGLRRSRSMHALAPFVADMPRFLRMVSRLLHPGSRVSR